MRKISILFFSFLFLAVALWFWDVIDVSDQTPVPAVGGTIAADNTADMYFSIGEVVLSGGAIITGIIWLATRNKD
jgi:hypothetical protein